MNIARLLPLHAPSYRALMLEAYASHPESFTSTAEERAVLPMSWWEERLSGDAGASSVVIGAWLGERLIGAAGILFETRAKLRHSASIFGMYVLPAHRRSGAGRALVEAAVDEARARPHVRNLQLTVTEGNTAAEELYARCGFRRWGVQPAAVAVGNTLIGKVHMWRDLSRAD
jgi:GNAT superfamily N-acetyltransferase